VTGNALRLASLRYLLRHPWQLALAIIGIALGVGVVVAVDLANEGARRSFELSTELVTGRATHQITAISGGVPESLYRELRLELGVRRSAPVIQATVVPEAKRGHGLTLLGLDPFAEGEYRGGLLGRRQWQVDLGRLLTEPGAVVITASLAHSQGLVAGDTWRLLAGPGEYSAHILAVLEDDGDSSSNRGLVLADIATAQAAVGQPERLTRIDLSLDEVAESELVVAIQSRLPPGVRLERSEARNNAVADLAAAFQLNLTAMSLLALMVGMFLIYNTMIFSVVQRRDLLGRLRALGVSRRQIFRVILGEAAVLGCLGTLLGLFLGVWLGHSLLALVAQTVDDLYYTLTVTEFTLAPLSLVKGALLGVLATLVTAAIPAWEAAHTPPIAVLRRSDLERRVRRRVPLLSLGAASLIGAGFLVLALIPRGLVAGFAGLFLVILGCALLAPAVLVALSRVASWAGGRAFGLIGRMAGRDLARHLSRTGVAVAALMVAVSATVGVAVMVDSFRGSVSLWLNELLNADLYVAPASIVTGDRSAVLDPRLIALLDQVPGVLARSLYRRQDTLVEGDPAQLIGVDPALQARVGYRFAAGEPSEAWRAFDSDAAVLISEPLAYRHQLRVGDTLTLEASEEAVALQIAGIFYDYGSEHGRILLRRALYSDYWQDSAVSSAGLYLDGGDLNAAAAAIELAAAPYQAVSVSFSRDIRSRSLAVFDRTFTITNVLRLLAVAVAFVGVLSALMAMLLERAREFAVLRAEGMTTGELARMLGLETGFLGLAAGLLAIPTGLVLAAILIFVINRRAFGWSMQFQVDPSILVEAIIVALAAALLAGVYPAWRLARSEPAEALRAD
jgi:putative ABC transport system permease protein